MKREILITSQFVSLTDMPANMDRMYCLGRDENGNYVYVGFVMASRKPMNGILFTQELVLKAFVRYAQSCSVNGCAINLEHLGKIVPIDYVKPVMVLNDWFKYKKGDWLLVLKHKEPIEKKGLSVELILHYGG